MERAAIQAIQVSHTLHDHPQVLEYMTLVHLSSENGFTMLRGQQRHFHLILMTKI